MVPTSPWEQRQTEVGSSFHGCFRNRPTWPGFPLLMSGMTVGKAGWSSADPSRERMASEPMKENKDPKSPLKLGEQ